MTDVNKAQLEKLGEKIDTIVGVNSTGTVGMKYDGGKILAGILFDDFAAALEAVAVIGTYGVKKYARNSWASVPDAPTRYKDAMIRHQLAMGKGEVYDEESHLLHAAHFAWNALATLQLLLNSGVRIHEYIGESSSAHTLIGNTIK